MQYENNVRIFFPSKTLNLVSKKYFSKRFIRKKGVCLIIRVILYSSQYGSSPKKDNLLKI